MIKKWTTIAIALVSIGLVASCGSDTNPDGGGQIVGDDDAGGGGNNSTPDGGPTDAADVTTPDATDAASDDADGSDSGADGGADDGGGDVDAGDDGGATGCDETSCAANEACVDGQCVEVMPTDKCQAAKDLGELTTTTPITISDTTEGATDVLATTCTDGGIEKVYKFTVAQDSLVSFDATWTGTMDAKLEFRSECSTQPPDEACFDSDSSIFVPANTPTWLVIEQDVAGGNGFTVELSAIEERCPAGQRSCASGRLEICSGGSQSQTYSCAADCADQSACAGDVCGEAIEVTADTTFRGDLGAYASNINFDGESFCARDDGSTVPTPGREVVFELPNLTQGQTVHIDARTRDSNLNAIFVLDSCTSTPYQCEQVMVNSEAGDFVAPADGTYYVVIDKLTTGGGNFEYSISFP